MPTPISLPLSNGINTDSGREKIGFARILEDGLDIFKASHMSSLGQFLNALLAAAILSGGAAHAQSYPRTVVDDRNKSVVLQRQPKSVASISTFGADLLTSLGRRVDGLSTLNNKQSAFLGDATAGTVNLGEVHQTNLDVLAKLSPDLIIGLRNYTEPFAKKIEETGKLLAFDLVTLDDSMSAVERASKAVGSEDKGAALNTRFKERLDEYAAKAPKGVSVVFLWHWADVPYAFYSHHLTTHIMGRLGAANVQGDTPTPQLKSPDSAAITMETLLRLNPDVIISFRGDDGPFPNHPVWSRLKAVKNGRAWRVGDQYIMSHGPIARDMVLREMAHLLHPERFTAPKDIPVKARASAMTFVH